MFTIIPFKFKDAWVFDEPLLDLDKEQFVNGADKIIEFIGKDLNDFENGFYLSFSNQQFDNYQYSLTFTNSECGGSWYVLDGYDMAGWLCPALFKFFPTAPEKLYVITKEASLSDRWFIKFKKKFSLKQPVVMR
jgi:hypothetical protein